MISVRGKLMLQYTKQVIGGSALLLLALSTSAAFAGNGGGTIFYAPPGALESTPVPVLGGFGLIILAGLLSVVSLRFIRQRKQSGHWLVAATLTGALAAGGGGIKLVSDAYAGINLYPMNNPSGGSIPVEYCGPGQLTNFTGLPQQITEMQNRDCIFTFAPIGGSGNGGSIDQGDCFAGKTLQDTGYCDFDMDEYE
jgi:hypothetical protein